MTSFRKVPLIVEGSSKFYPKSQTLEEVQHEMKDYVDSLYEKIFSQEMPVKVSTWVLHRFNAIHPFLDGNGRASRLLMNMVLVHFKLPAIFFKNDEETDRYSNALMEADNGNFEPLEILLSDRLENSKIPDIITIPTFVIKTLEEEIEVKEEPEESRFECTPQ